LELQTQFQKLVGYNVPVSHEDLLAMSQSRVGSLFDFGQYMWTRMSPELRQNMPWAAYGMDRDSFHAGMLDYGGTYFALTGETATPEVLAQAFKERYSGGEWRQHLTRDANMQKTYGWLRFGMEHQEFVRYKREQRQAFGSELTDEQAVKQLEYRHASHDPMAVAAPVARETTKRGGDPELGASVVR
jgi:hypothetical protein